MAKTIKTTFKLRRGTATEWLAANPILNQGEPGFEIDTNKLKIGNGMDRWNKLEYIAGEASEDASGGGAAEIYIGTTAPTGKYKLWINPEGEISEGGTGDYGKEIEVTKTITIGPDSSQEELEGWDFHTESMESMGIPYLQLMVQTPEQTMFKNQNFSFSIKLKDINDPIIYSGEAAEKTIQTDEDTFLLFYYIGSSAIVDALMQEEHPDFSIFDGINYLIGCGLDDGDNVYNNLVMILPSFDFENIEYIQFVYNNISYKKLPANALTEGAHIKIDQENTQINCTVGEPIGISKWKTFGIQGISSASTISKYSNNYLYTLQGSYEDKYLTPYNSTHAFEIASEAYTSSPQFYYSSATARNINNLVNPNGTDSFYSQTQSNQYKIFIDYMTPDRETITIDCKGLGHEDQNTIDEFNSLFNLHNQNLNYFFGRYNTLTPAYNISKGIVPEDENKESFFIIFIFAEKWTNCIPILLTDKELNNSERQIFSDSISQPLYDRISLRSLSYENNLFLNNDNDGLVIGYSNIYSGYQNIIFGSSNKFLTYGSRNIIFGESNTINYGDYGIIFGHNNNIRGNYNIILENNNSFSSAYGTITAGSYNTISNTSQAAIFGYGNTFSVCENIVNVGSNNRIRRASNIGVIGTNLSNFEGNATLITGYYNAYLSAYYGSSMFSPYADIFQVGGGNDQQRLNAFGVRPNCCYRQEYNSDGSFAHTFKIWDDKMKLPSMSSGTTTAELIQALISAGIMEGGNE